MQNGHGRGMAKVRVEEFEENITDGNLMGKSVVFSRLTGVNVIHLIIWDPVIH